MKLSGLMARTSRNIALYVSMTSLVCILLLYSGSIRAQVGTADVLGTVTDPSGALVRDATVTIKNLGTADKRTATTDAVGEFIFTTLPNGSYTLTVKASGFKEYSVVGIPLAAGDRARYDAKLETGAVSERVVVTGEVAALQTDSSTVSSSIEDTLVQDLPLNNRQFVTALEIQPGMNAGAQGSASANANGTTQDRRPEATFTANGQTSAPNNYMIDGFDNNERQNGLIGLQPSIDGIAEVKVDTNTYRAEYGRTAGAVVNVITKSGTNDFHGSAYDYFRNDILDASSYNFNSTAEVKPKYRQNNFGGSLVAPFGKTRRFSSSISRKIA